jgi:Flp pilus assembly pilin Flp
MRGLSLRKGNNMKRVQRILVSFFEDESGTETLEWGLVCGLLVVGAITAITLIGPKVTDMWSDLNNEIPEKD